MKQKAKQPAKRKPKAMEAELMTQPQPDAKALAEIVEEPRITALMVPDGSIDMQSLMKQAIQKGNIDIVERLVALAERQRKQWAHDQYFLALAAFQKECPEIRKVKAVEGKDGKLRYRYAPIESIVAQVKDLLDKHGFSYSLDAEFVEGAMVGVCKSHHKDGHTEETRFRVPIGSEYMTDQQAVGAAGTFATRYAFRNAYGLMTADEDNDANHVEPPKEERKGPAPVKQQSAAQQKKAPLNPGMAAAVEELTGVKNAMNKSNFWDAAQLKVFSDEGHTTVATGDVEKVKDLAAKWLALLTDKQEEFLAAQEASVRK